MLRARGWLALVLAGAMGIGGRVLGAPELYVLSSSMAALVVLSFLYVFFTRSGLQVVRQVRPTQAQVGSSAHVDLQVTNRGRRRSGVVSLNDEVTGTNGASVLVPPLKAGTELRASYSLPTDRRGVLVVGPLQVVRSDPLELASAQVVGAGRTEVTVFPRIDRVTPVPPTTGNDPLAGSEHPDALGRGGEDFYALRPYVVGDDLRRVHWPSTARQDDLMIRQEEIPWQGRVTILLDDRPDRCAPQVFEQMVSAAASLVAASAQRQDLLRLVTTQGLETAFGSAHRHTSSLMEHLATVDAHAGPQGSPLATVLDPALAALDAGASPGALVSIVADLPDFEMSMLDDAGRRFGATHVVCFRDGTGDPRGRPSAGSRRIEVEPGSRFCDAWDQAMAGRAAARGMRR